MIASVRLILASASPRRAELLTAAGFTFETVIVDVDESVRPGEAPGIYVRRLAMEKSARGLEILEGPPNSGFNAISHPDLIVLGADTAVIVDGEILGKPREVGDAQRMLRRLSGRRHQVMTGVSLRGNAVEVGRVVTTMVDVMPLSPADVAWYVASGEGLDKAGGYAVQGLASRFIVGIEGSYANVVGLPVAEVSSLLRDLASAGRSRYSE